MVCWIINNCVNADNKRVILLVVFVLFLYLKKIIIIIMSIKITI